MQTKRLIGLSVDTVGGYGREIIRGVMEFCHQNPHWQVAIEPTVWLYEEMPSLTAGIVDGMILQAKSQESVDRVMKADVPAVNIANMRRLKHSPPMAIPDDVAVGKMAADYLIGLNYPELAFFSCETIQFSEERKRGFRAEATARGYRPHIWQANDVASDKVDRWVAQLPKPVGVFCGNDYWALRILSSALRQGLDVPNDVAVLGVDDDELFNTLGEVSLSSIALPAGKIGYRAAQLLETVMNGKPVASRTTLPPICVMARESTEGRKFQDPVVAGAISFIKTNVARPFQVEDILNHLKTSRRTLERRFQSAVGKSLAMAVRHQRVEHAKMLLTVSSLSVGEIAKASGFVSSTMLGIVFRQLVGTSPSIFRDRSACHSALPVPDGATHASSASFAGAV